jgi:hypothetical protein
VITAASGLYIVTFDGNTLIVSSRRNSGRVLWRVSVENLMAVDFKPAGPMSPGRLYLRGMGRPTPYDAITFSRKEQEPFEALAQALYESLDGREAQSPQAATHRLTHRDVAFMRTMSGGTSTSVMPVVLGFAIVLVVAIVAMWAFIS